MKIKQMWAVCHTPSGSWDHGEANLTLYPFKHIAQRECNVHPAFKPIKVWVTDQKPGGADE